MARNTVEYSNDKIEYHLQKIAYHTKKIGIKNVDPDLRLEAVYHLELLDFFDTETEEVEVVEQEPKQLVEDTTPDEESAAVVSQPVPVEEDTESILRSLVV